MEIIENKALRFVTRKHELIKKLIPKSAILETNGDKARMLVHWDADEAQILRNVGIKNVPHPILGRYKWPGVYTPFIHQRDTAAFLATHPRCLCLSEAGTGKTSAAAWAADYLMSKGYVTRVLVVCPMSIMDTAWRADLFRTVMHRTVAIASGDRRRREEVIDGDYEFVIINFDGVKVVQKALAEGGFDLIIVDEANAIKNVSTDRWKALASLVTAHTRLWLMTGTPASQSPVDAYGLAKLVNPTGVPKFFGSFRDMVMVKVSQYRYLPRMDSQDTVHKALQPAIRYTKEECLDLPEMLYTTREVPLTKQQLHYYELIRKEMVALAAGEEITARNAAGLINKLLQISQGAAYSTNREVVEFDITARIEELMDVIEQSQQKIIVFIPYRHVMDKVADELNKRIVKLIGFGKGHGVSCIHGGVSAGERATIFKQFQTEENPRILLIVPQAAAHGVTLTAADTVVWWGPVTSAELYIQGNARAHRAGQKNKVTVVRLQGSSVEKRMYGLLNGKVDLHNALVDLYKQEIE